MRFGEEALVVAPTLVTDAEEIAAAIAASLPELRRFMPWSHAPQTARSQLQRLLEVEADYFAGRELTMGLFRERPSERRELLAMVGLHPRVDLNPNALEVGYWAPTPHAKKGYVTFGVKCLVAYAFDKLECDRVQVMTDETNAGSLRVIEKCGFVYEATLRNVVAAPTPELVAGGYVGCGRNPMFALFPDTFAALPWVEEVRACVRYVNLAGYALPDQPSGADPGSL